MGYTVAALPDGGVVLTGHSTEEGMGRQVYVAASWSMVKEETTARGSCLPSRYN